MPLINELKHLELEERPNKPKVLSSTNAEYYIVEKDSKKYIHINTYAKHGQAVDQTIQLSPAAVKQLAKIIAEEFL
jgi:hypothetical protein